jgi:hypothetical protein
MSTGRSYYGRPVIKQPVWTWEIPWYFFTGGLAGGSATLAAMAGAAGNRELARRAWPVALAAAAVSPGLLVSDLGRPERFLNMLRMFKVTSPMSMGSWILATTCTLTGVAAVHEALGRFQRVGPAAKLGAAVLGPALATYTGVLLSDTSVPVWHEGRRELPFAFGGAAMASAGAAAAILTPPSHAGPARRLAVTGAAVEVAAMRVMQRRMGEAAAPYRHGPCARYSAAARALTTAGAAALGLAARRSRLAALAGGVAVLSGAVLERWAVFKAGFASARDPRYTVAPQRGRIDAAR